MKTNEVTILLAADLRDCGTALVAAADGIDSGRHADQHEARARRLVAIAAKRLGMVVLEPASAVMRQRAAKDWRCNECSHRLTLRQAEKASRDVQGCPKCGGADIDLAPVGEMAVAR